MKRIKIFEGYSTKLKSSILVDIYIEQRVRAELFKNFTIYPRFLRKVASFVDSSIALPTNMFYKEYCINNKVTDYIKDIKSDKLYKVKYLYQYSHQTEDYFFTEVKEVSSITLEKCSMIEITVSEKNKFIDINLYSLSKDLDFEYVEYSYTVKDV